MNKKILLRDFFIANIAGGAGVLVMFVGIVLQKMRILPNFPCAFLHVTHMYCPGCGGTRALFALLKGDIIHSLGYNPTVVLGALILLYYEITVIMTIVSKRDRVYYTKSPLPILLYISIVLIFAIVRDVLLVVFSVDMLDP